MSEHSGGSLGLYFILNSLDQAHDLINVANEQRLQWSRSSLERFCRMNNRQKFQRLLDPILVPRIVGTQSHDDVAEHLSRTLSVLGFTIEWDLFKETTPHSEKPFRTLIATHDGSVPRRLVFACHYDSKFLKEVFIGATDSAVPCAMLLEMARTLECNSSIDFFDGEEAFEKWSEKDSLYGSRHLASKWNQEYFMNNSQLFLKMEKEIDRIDLIVLLDLLGTPDPAFYYFNGHLSESAFLEMVNIEMKLKEIGCLHQLPIMFRSQTVYTMIEDDHTPFLNLNVPVLHLIPLPFPDVWHKTSDNASALNYETIDNLNSILRVFISKYLGLVA
ncbi:Glutaminyl-peptide cyclotransferase [Dirofilaria immitis]|nr:Glutaminyl-peptide cyclotransferase [Dirofilaria immitis]